MRFEEAKPPPDADPSTKRSGEFPHWYPSQRRRGLPDSRGQVWVPASLGVPLTALACPPTLLPLGGDGAHAFPSLEGGEGGGGLGAAPSGGAAAEEGAAEEADGPVMGEILAEATEASSKAMEEGCDAEAEGAALADIFGNEAYKERLSAKLGGRWAGILAKWGTWEGAEASAVGGAVAEVMEKLAAPHLRATSIKAQLDAGNDASAFGLATLLTNMVPPE